MKKLILETPLFPPLLIIIGVIFFLQFFTTQVKSIVVVVLSFFGLQKGGSGASKVIIVVLLGLWGYIGVLKKMKTQWAFVSVVLFMVVSIGLSIWVTENLQYIIEDTLQKDMSLSGRTDFWPDIVGKILQRPFLGYGVGGFWQPWRGVDNPAHDIIVVKSGFRPQHSHNGFFELGLALGITGLFLFFLSFVNNIFKAVVHLSRIQQPEAGLPLQLLTYILMTNITECGIFAASHYWFWYVVLTVRLSLDMRGRSNPPGTISQL